MLQPQPGFTQGPQRHLQLPRFPSSFPPTLISESGGEQTGDAIFVKETICFTLPSGDMY